jgi:hypothetical protein
MKASTAEINGKVYPFWGQFVDKSDEFKGGTLEDFGDSMDRRMGFNGATTTIVMIHLRKNGTDSAFFEVIGQDFSTGFDVKYGGVITGDDGWITFSGYGGHKWRIQKQD